MARAMAELKVPGAAVGVIRNGEVVLAKGYGVRDLDSKAAVTERTVFATGSVTKSFTAAAIAALVDEGKLEWDRPVREYLPWFRLDDPHATELITLRDMLSHRSGMPRHDWIRFTIALDRLELVRRMRYLPFNKPFREEFQYNNLMYVAAGLIAGEVSGKTWEDLVQERLFTPIGMTGSSTSVRDMQRAPDFAKPHVLRSGAVAAQVPFYNYQKYGVGPNGAVNSNVADMLRYLQFFLANGKAQGRQVISEVQMRELRRPAMVAGTDTYALGWYIRHERGYTISEHGGAITGFTANIRLVPQDRLAIVVLNNLGSALPGLVADELTGRLLGFPAVDRFERLRAARSQAATPQGRPQPVPATKPSHPLAAYAGKYRNAAFGDLPVEFRDGALVLGIPESPATMRHMHFDTFEADGRMVQFQLDERGRVTGLRLPLEAAVPPFAFERVPATSAVP